MKIKLSISFLLLFFLPLFSIAQKAYDAVMYTGETQNISVKFTLANGYVNGSEIKTIDKKTKKTSRFLPANGTNDSRTKTKFYHYSPAGKKFSDYFLLEGLADNYENVPVKIIGKYFFNGTFYRIVFNKN